MGIGISIKNKMGEPVCFIESEQLDCIRGNLYLKVLSFELSLLIPGTYIFYIIPYSWSNGGNFIEYDETDMMNFEIIEGTQKSYNWLKMYWGNIKPPKSSFLN